MLPYRFSCSVLVLIIKREGMCARAWHVLSAPQHYGSLNLAHLGASWSVQGIAWHSRTPVRNTLVSTRGTANSSCLPEEEMVTGDKGGRSIYFFEFFPYTSISCFLKNK